MDIFIQEEPPADKKFKLLSNTYCVGVTWLMLTLNKPITHQHTDTLVRMLERLGEKYINTRASNGLTALMVAVAGEYANVEIVRALLRAGANPNASMEDGWTALTTAARHCNESSVFPIMKLLLDAGADPNARIGKNYNVLIALLQGQHGDNVNKIVDLLLRANADISATDDNECDALNTAIIHCKSRRILSIMRLLLDAGADPNNPNINGITPLMFATQCRQPDNLEGVMKILLRAGADINARDGNCNTAITYAVRKHNCGSIKRVLGLLIRAGADVNALSYHGWSTLMTLLAVRCNCDATAGAVEILIAAGARVDAKSNQGNTALTLAITRYRNAKMLPKVVTALIRAGADVNVESPLALQYASIWSFHAGERRKNITNPTVLTHAVYLTRNDKVIEMLLAAGATSGGADIRPDTSKYRYELDELINGGISLYHPDIKQIFGHDYHHMVVPKLSMKAETNKLIKESLNYQINAVKFKPGNMGEVITYARAMSECYPADEWWHMLGEDLIDYLGITDVDDAKRKIADYLTIDYLGITDVDDAKRKIADYLTM